MNHQLSIPRLLLPLAVVAYWTIGFYPFQWFSPFTAHKNFVEPTFAGGFTFSKQGIAYSKTAPQWVSTAIENNAFEVDLEVIPYNVGQIGPARIFTVSADNNSRNFTVGQSGRGLAIRLRTTESGPNGRPTYKIQEVFRRLIPRRISVRVANNELRVEVNGHQRLIARLPANALSAWNPRYRLAIGNEFTYQRPWRGEVKAVEVRVRDHTWRYTAADLQTPNRYHLSSDIILGEISQLISNPFEVINPADWIINLVGFIPMGLLLTALGQRVSKACIWCGILSLSIEVGQFCVMTRSPSGSDLLLNILGGAIGAWSGNQLGDCNKSVETKESRRLNR